MEYPPRNLDLTCFNWVKLIIKTQLPSNSKYLGLYLSTYMNSQQDMAWPSLKRIEGETGLSHPSVLKYLDLLVSEGWLVKQSGSRTESNKYWINVPKSVIQEVGKLPTYVTSEEKVGKEVTSNNNRITNTLSQRFIPPTIGEVEAYVETREIKIDPEKFVDWNQSKGWLIGKNKMKDWRAAVRTWEKRENANTKQNAGQRTDSRRLSPGDQTRAIREQRRREQSTH
jgi:hypothetical protein